MASTLRVLLLLAVLVFAGCTAPDDEEQSTSTPPTQTTRQPTSSTPPTSGATPPVTPTSGGGSDQMRMLTGVNGEARYTEMWDAAVVGPKLESAGFTIVSQNDTGAVIKVTGNDTMAHVMKNANGTALRMEFPSAPKNYSAADESLEDAVDDLVEAAIPGFEEVAARFEDATGWRRTDTVWLPVISTA